MPLAFWIPNWIPSPSSVPFLFAFSTLHSIAPKLPSAWLQSPPLSWSAHFPVGISQPFSLHLFHILPPKLLVCRSIGGCAVPAHQLPFPLQYMWKTMWWALIVSCWGLQVASSLLSDCIDIWMHGWMMVIAAPPALKVLTDVPSFHQNHEWPARNHATTMMVIWEVSMERRHSFGWFVWHLDSHHQLCHLCQMKTETPGLLPQIVSSVTCQPK